MSSLYQNSEDCIHMLLTILFGVTQPLIPLKWLCLLVRKAWRLKRERVKLGSHSTVGVHEGSLYLPYVKIQICFMCFQISIIILDISASYFLDMVMLIS